MDNHFWSHVIDLNYKATVYIRVGTVGHYIREIYTHTYQVFS